MGSVSDSDGQPVRETKKWAVKGNTKGRRSLPRKIKKNFLEEDMNQDQGLATEGIRGISFSSGLGTLI